MWEALVVPENENSYTTHNKFITERELTGDIYWNGIDRVDSSLGYINENCVSCCRTCNYAKLEMNIKDFLDWVQRISKYQGFC